MSSALDRKGDVHDSNAFNFQGHVAQIIKEKLSWIHAAVAEHANKQLGLETISAWFMGVTLTWTWDFLFYGKESRENQKAKSSLFQVDDTKLFLPYAVSSGSTCSWGVVWAAVSRARKTFPVKPHQISPGYNGVPRQHDGTLGPLASQHDMGMQISFLNV